MQDGDKLLLYPQEPLFHHDTWDCIGEQQFVKALATTKVTPDPVGAGAGSFDAEYNTPQGGLSPAKRGSQGFVNLYSMEYQDRFYVEKDSPSQVKQPVSLFLSYSLLFL